MKYLALALALCLGACTTTDAITAGATTADAVGVPAPVTYANQTALDEQGMLAAELAYKAARIAVETGVDAGMIKGATAARIAGLDNQAFAALGVARAAYRTGNATSYRTALTNAQSAIAGFLALTGRSN